MTQKISHGDTHPPQGQVPRESAEIFNKSLGVFVSPWLRRFAVWLLPLSFLVAAFFLPLSRILALTFDPHTLTSQNLLLAFRVLLFTFYQATFSTVLTLLLG